MNLSIRNLVLNYSYKSVLKDVSVQFQEGKIHAVLGDNGAGKSTLAKIISGEIIADSGEIRCNNSLIFPSAAFSVKSSIDAGICCVHQRPLLAESGSIYENVILGLKKIDKNQIAKLMKIWLPSFSENTLVKDTGSDCRFFTALICALLKNPEILILDEPCALLDENQTAFLYKNLKILADEGKNIIVITHSEKEAENFCDTVTILEDGKIVYNGNTFDEGWKDKIFLKKTDKKPLQNQETFTQEKNESFITFSSLTCTPSGKPALSDISFTAKGGEITLISGLPEDGIGTLENVICGMEKSRFSGSFILNILKNQNNKPDNICCKLDLKGKNFNTTFLRNKTGCKTGIISSNKTFRASNPDLTIEQMLFFSPLSAEELIAKAEINIRPEEKVSCLSGGMLQRLILQRELSFSPDFLICCSPLQGLDFSSSEKICTVLAEQAEQGKIVLVLSAAEFPENLCRSRYKLKAGKLFQV